MDGILYGTGTGPGDPSLMTLKAVKVIEECDIIALPVSDTKTLEEPFTDYNKRYASTLLKGCMAYKTALPNVPGIADKPVLYMPMPMCKDKDRLKKLHDQDAEKIEEHIKSGKKVCFLVLGDPVVYSTYMYIHKRIIKKGYSAEIINGVTSFCACAAALGMGLVKNREQLHIIPASYNIKDTAKLPGTKVFMKAGKSMAELKQEIAGSGQEAVMVENCGMDNEKIYKGFCDIPDQAGYYSVLILKEED